MTTVQQLHDPAGTDQIAIALVAVQGAMPTVHKGKEADTGKYKYSYADLADVSAEVTPLLAANGLAFVCSGRHVDRGYELVGRLIHTSGQHVESALPLYGNDMQALGSAITYARRYLLGCLTGVVTDDDTDAGPAQKSTRSRAWDGPTTAALLNSIDADAKRAGVTYEQAVAKLMQQHRFQDVAQLDALDPWLVQPHAESVRAHADKIEADRARAEQDQAATDAPASGAE